MGKTAKQKWAWLKQGRPVRLEHTGVWPRLGKPLEKPSEPVPAELVVRVLRMVNSTGQWQSASCADQPSSRTAEPVRQLSPTISSACIVGLKGAPPAPMQSSASDGVSGWDPSAGLWLLGFSLPPA